MWPTSVDKVWRHRDVKIEFGSVGCVTGVCPRVKRPVCVKCSQEQWGGGHKRRKFYNKKITISPSLALVPPSPMSFSSYLSFPWNFPEGNKRKEMSRRRVTKLNLTVELTQSVEFIGHQTRAFSVAAARHVTGHRPINDGHQTLTRILLKLEFQLLRRSNSWLVCKWGSVKCLRPGMSQWEKGQRTRR